MPKKPSFSASAKEQAHFEKLLRKELDKHEPNPAFRDALYGKLMREHIERQHAAAPTQAGFFDLLNLFFRRASAFTVAAIFLIVASGITMSWAYVSPNVNRESNFYFLKRWAESVEYATAVSEESKGEKHLKFAERRLEEAETLSNLGLLDEETINEAIANTNQAHEIATQVQDDAAKTRLNSLVAQQSQRQRRKLSFLAQEAQSQPDGAAALANLEESMNTVAAVELAALDTIETVRPNPERIGDVRVVVVAQDEFVIKQAGSISLQITNIGTQSIAGFPLDVRWDNRTQRLQIPNLSRDEQRMIEVRHTFEQPGEYTFIAQADPNGELRERTTANNRVTLTLLVANDTPDECDTPGDRQCDGRSVVECTTAPGDNHRTWQPIKQCTGEQRCVDGACTSPPPPTSASSSSAAPTCNNACPEAGAVRCNGNSILTCTADRAGCLDWEDTGSCDDTEVCSNGHCRMIVCGDGVLDNTELCDDGNTTDGDGCSATCQTEACGDDIVQPTEACDDGNTTDDDGCSASCEVEEAPEEPEPVCGDGTVDEGEACDDGNLEDGDGCSGVCEVEEEPEEDPAPDTGTGDTTVGACGDGTVDEGEACDDGNLEDGDGCNGSCEVE